MLRQGRPGAWSALLLGILGACALGGGCVTLLAIFALWLLSGSGGAARPRAAAGGSDDNVSEGTVESDVSSGIIWTVPIAEALGACRPCAMASHICLCRLWSATAGPHSSHCRQEWLTAHVCDVICMYQPAVHRACWDGKKRPLLTARHLKGAQILVSLLLTPQPGFEVQGWYSD